MNEQRNRWNTICYVYAKYSAFWAATSLNTSSRTARKIKHEIDTSCTFLNAEEESVSRICARVFQNSKYVCICNYFGSSVIRTGINVDIACTLYSWYITWNLQWSWNAELGSTTDIKYLQVFLNIQAECTLHDVSARC